MDHNENELACRLEAATALLERTLNWLEERGTQANQFVGQIERISATIESTEPTKRESELAEKLAAAEREIESLRTSACSQDRVPPQALRRTVPASTTEMLAKHGIGDGPVDVRALDAALAGLSLEQRIAVKSQLLRAGAIA